MPGCQEVKKRVSNSLELESQMVVSSHWEMEVRKRVSSSLELESQMVGSWKSDSVLWKSTLGLHQAPPPPFLIFGNKVSFRSSGWFGTLKSSVSDLERRDLRVLVWAAVGLKVVTTRPRPSAVYSMHLALQMATRPPDYHLHELKMSP